MFSLSYTPAYDPYHTVFRLLVILASAEECRMPIKTARTADFFYCFPWMLKDVRAPRNIDGFARARNRIVRANPQTSYDRFPSARIVFERMEMIHSTAVSALVGAKMVGHSDVSAGILTLKRANVPHQLWYAVESATAKTPDLLNFLAVSLPKIDLIGGDGLFARTGLGDYGYDVI